MNIENLLIHKFTIDRDDLNYWDDPPAVVERHVKPFRDFVEANFTVTEVIVAQEYAIDHNKMVFVFEYYVEEKKIERTK